jgi:hypothetical protein
MLSNMKSDPKQGVVITIENFEYQWTDIKLKKWGVEKFKLPVEIWQKKTHVLDI